MITNCKNNTTSYDHTSEKINIKHLKYMNHMKISMNYYVLWS